jgi:dethiobiotin synthetase
MSVVLVAGTDTGVGKTWVSRALAHSLRAAGRRVVAIKPVETGCVNPAGPWEDGALLAAASGQTSPQTALRRLAAPVAPVLACEAEGVAIDFYELVLEIESLGASAEVTLIEGAGGVLTPITWGWNALNLGQALDARVLLVAGDRLGTINHTMLTLVALERAAIEVCGVVLSAPAAPDRSTGTNARAIARLSGIERVVTLPRAADPLLSADCLAPVVEWVLPA